MASIIRIKRSSVSGNPSTLAAGELAYSALQDNGSNGGDRLYIGMGTETAGNAVNHIVVGGKYFTDMLDHVAGTLTANSALIVDSNKKIDDLYVDNIQLNGSTISTTSTNTDLTLSPNGTGKVSIAGAYSLPRVDGTDGYVLTTDGSGNVTWAAASSSLDIAGDGSTSGSVNLLTQSLTVSGGDGITTTVSSQTITIDADSSIARRADTFYIGTTEVALNRAYGALGLTGITSVAFNGSTSGSITVQATATAGSNTLTLPAATDTLVGRDTTDTLTNKSFDTTDNSLYVDGNAITSYSGSGNIVILQETPTLNTPYFTTPYSDTLTAYTTNLTLSAASGNNDVILAPTGTGTVDVSSKRITSVATPSASTDAATKGYVDATKSGLDVKDSVRLATTENLVATYDNGTSGVGATLTNNGTQASLLLDGVPAAIGYRVLIKNQDNAEQNGIYVVTDNGSNSTNWVITRTTDFNSSTTITPGAFTFVEQGNTQEDNGYVLTTNNSVTVGTSELTFSQFSGAGQVVDGDALLKTGNRLDVVVAASGGIEIYSDALQLSSSLAGDGLSYAAGVLTVGGTTDRITISSDSVDIASTYEGQTSIITLGTVSTGTWSADTIATNKGGTGLTSYSAGDLLYASSTDVLSKLSAGTEGKVLQIGAGGLPVWGDIDGGTY